MSDAVPAFELPVINDPAAVPTGDMPGDSIQIGQGHVSKAQTIFPRMWELLTPYQVTGDGRAVVAVHGGSGVGKSEVGSLLAHYLRANGVGAYVMSGDNYPRRIPGDNDAERLRTYRAGALRGLVDAGQYDDTVREELPALRSRRRPRHGQRPPLAGRLRASRPDSAGRLPGYAGGDQLR